jgi:hypothetical protein
MGSAACARESIAVAEPPRFLVMGEGKREHQEMEVRGWSAWTTTVAGMALYRVRWDALIEMRACRFVFIVALDDAQRPATNNTAASKLLGWHVGGPAAMMLLRGASEEPSDLHAGYAQFLTSLAKLDVSVYCDRHYHVHALCRELGF